MFSHTKLTILWGITMPFETLQAYQEAALNAVQRYQDDYHFIKNKHHQTAEDFKLKITQCNTKDDLSEKLYNFYIQILHKNSRDLAKNIAIVLAQEKNLSLSEVSNYHELRARPGMLLRSNAIWFGGKNDEYFGGKRYWDHIEGILDKDEGDSREEKIRAALISIHDPIIIAFEKLQCAVTELNEVELSETLYAEDKPSP